MSIMLACCWVKGIYWSSTFEYAYVYTCSGGTCPLCWMVRAHVTSMHSGYLHQISLSLSPSLSLFLSLSLSACHFLFLLLVLCLMCKPASNARAICCNFRFPFCGWVNGLPVAYVCVRVRVYECMLLWKLLSIAGFCEIYEFATRCIPQITDTHILYWVRIKVHILHSHCSARLRSQLSFAICRRF